MMGEHPGNGGTVIMEWKGNEIWGRCLSARVFLAAHAWMGWDEPPHQEAGAVAGATDFWDD